MGSYDYISSINLHYVFPSSLLEGVILWSTRANSISWHCSFRL